MDSARTHMTQSLPVRTVERRTGVLRLMNLVQALVVRGFKGALSPFPAGN